MKTVPASYPLQRFSEWLQAASETEEDATAMVLATSDAYNQPSARVVLLKHIDEHGFIFYTNLYSAKATDLQHNPKAALCFYWPTQSRQVRICGIAEKIGDTVADRYFATRPRGSQISAWASRQSRPMQDITELEQRVQHTELQFKDDNVPRPDFWSGYCVVPDTIEFWQAGNHRLHQRWLYQRQSNEWQEILLYP